MKKAVGAVLALSVWAGAAVAAPVLVRRGVVLTAKDLSGELDWPKLAHEAGLTTIATHVGPGDVMPFIRNEKGRKFLADCRAYGLDVEHELHAMSYLLPRRLFAEHPDYFRMDGNGQRTNRLNCCASSAGALAVIASNAVAVAKVCRPTTGRYFYWLDDTEGDASCHCEKCRGFNAADQALLVENAILAALRKEVDPKATLAHLAYYRTMTPPSRVKPADGIFLEYANITRNRSRPLSDVELGNLKRLLAVFPAETAQVLEYWLDASLYSKWRKPSVRLPWSASAVRREIDDYAKLGIRRFTTFGVYLDGDYVRNHGFPKEVLDYGAALRDWPYAAVPEHGFLGVPDRVVFSKDECGQDLMTLKGPGGSLVLSMQGAQIRSWRPTGQDEVLYRPATMRFSGNTEVRGGIPLCWPWFGACGEPGSQPHGVARHGMFELVSAEADSANTCVQLRLDAKGVNGLGSDWVRFDYRVKLCGDGRLELTGYTTNLGKSPCRVTEGIHPYWRVSDRRQVRVEGLDGARYCFAEETQEPTSVWTGDFAPGARHFDHVFWMATNTVTVVDPGLGRRITVASENLPRIVVWTPPEFKLGDFENLPPEDMWTFICVEPGRLFRPAAYELKPRQWRSFTVRVSVSGEEMR